MKKIITWNVNGIRASEKKGFLTWLEQTSPDILCIQETKANPSQLSKELLAPNFADGTSYKTYFSSAQKLGYSGTAIYTKTEPINIIPFGYPEFDAEGRVVIAEYPDAHVISAYFPNSQEGGRRLGYKLDFCAAMLETCNNLVSSGENVILLGDYNIAHKEIDLANPKGNEKNPGFLPEERAWMDSFVDSGYVDCFRHFCKDGEHYTWWTYRFKAREKNIGWRIDYACVNESFMPRVKETKILSDVMGSDHCPVLLSYS